MKKIAKVIVLICCLAVWTGSRVHAAELPDVMNAYTTSDSVVVFVRNQGKTIENVYLGNEEALDFSTEDVNAVRTVVILDNSLSINQDYRDEIKSFLTDLVAARNDGDTFTIATFAENITYLVEESNNYLDIKEKIDGLQFENQDSYFNNVLYTAIDDIGKYEEIKYTRIIVIADGVDDEALGYTDDELNKKIQTAKLPVYAIGCTSKGNEENLKKMFALARLSNAKSYLLDDVSGNDILQDIVSEAEVTRVDIIPRDESCDGTSKAVRISYGEDYCATEMNMPFKAAAQEAPPVESDTEPTAEPETETEPVAEPETVPVTEPITEPVPDAASEPEEGSSLPIALIGIILAVVLAVAFIVILIIVRAKKREPRKREPSVDLSGIGQSEHTNVMDNNDGKTELLVGGGARRESEHTDIIVGSSVVKLMLQDMDNPERTFEYPVRDKILIGRSAAKCQIVINYSKIVSSVHCEVVVKGKSLYVRDGGEDVIASTNGTYVNGEKVAPELPLPSGSVLKLGQVRFKVTYR